MVTVNRGDVVTALMSGAGGYGNPFERDTEMVARDVTRGIVSEQAARDDYGVIVVDGVVDSDETKKLRDKRPQPDGKGFHFGPEREAWEAVFDHQRMLTLNQRLENLPVDERQRRRHALFRALEPRLMTPATDERHAFTELFSDADNVRARLDELLASGWD
jgi:N-methylhydantoinase B